ncbi:unnamed protein product [Enterobius vermicularis]|uniref:Exocyst complex component 7 n=1 Tax=Enterobius vermicularis TaxID=51028 RepID=A0A0N4UXT8_ENTVE|nr:unnamed protein product [Enterobius vermicularis]
MLQNHKSETAAETAVVSVTANVAGKLKQDDEWLKWLEENVEKSRELRDQIVTRLDSFENCLKMLEERIVPLHNKTAIFQKRQTNLSKVIKTIDAMQQFYGQATELESAIREGSASLDRENYIEKMDQLADAITFFSSHPTYQNQLESMKLTFESGCVTLEKEFRNVVQSNSIVADAAHVIECLDQDFEVIPARLKEVVSLRDGSEIVQLARWLLSRNPNGSLVQNYASIRGDNMLRTLSNVLQYSGGTKQSLTPVAKPSPISLKQALKRATGRSSDRFGAVKDWRTSDETVSGILLAFGSLLALIQVEVEVMGITINDLTTEARIQRVMFAQPLRSVIERSSKIFDGLDCSLVPLLPLLKHISTHYNQLASLSNVSLRILMFSVFFARVLSALRLNLKNKADNYGTDETLAAVFLLNNNSYIHHVLQNDGVFALICEHNSEIRSFYKYEINFIGQYLFSWDRVISSLVHEVVPYDDKQAYRNTLLTFTSEFEKLIAAQKGYCIADVKVSQSIKDSIRKLLLEPYTDFYNRFLSDIWNLSFRIMRSPFAKSLEKHIKYTPDSLEMVIDRLFDVSA